MLALIYLCSCILVGASILYGVSPEIFQKDLSAYNRKKLAVSPVLLWLPASGVTGILLVTWSVYIMARILYGSDHPLLYANMVVLLFWGIVLAVTWGMAYKRGRRGVRVKANSSSFKNYGVELIFFLLCFGFVTYLMYYTFHIRDNTIYVGGTLAGDFSVHLGMIRSFSWGDNFITSYTLYGGEDIRYHFMYQFLVGNLEFLGMRIEHALNLSSAITMLFASMLLYVLTVKVSGKGTAGYLSVLFFYFRSSESLFHYIAETPKEENLIKKLSSNRAYIGYTPNENWGIWGWNVFVNQRHLAISLAVALLVILMVLPKLYEMFRCFRTLEIDRNSTLFSYVRECFLKKDSWQLKDYKVMILLGMIAGGSAFFNGAVFIALIVMVFFLAALSKNRLDFVVFAGIAGVLSLVQSHVFIYGEAVSPEYYFGFLAEAKTLWGVLYFLIRLLGVLVVVLAAAFMHYRGINRYLIVVFLTPAILTFTVKMTNDINVNHKYLFISCMMLDVIAATYVADLVRKKDYVRNVCVGILVLILTSTGLYDIHSLKMQNTEEKSVRIAVDDPISTWIRENTSSTDLFLTAPYALNSVTVAGAMLYQGYEYVCWSAGYDVNTRHMQVAAMYSATNQEQLKRLVEQNGITYIIVDRAVRSQEGYTVNEAVIAATYESAYTQGDGEDKFTIYDTTQVLQ